MGRRKNLLNPLFFAKVHDTQKKKKKPSLHIFFKKNI